MVNNGRVSEVKALQLAKKEDDNIRNMYNRTNCIQTIDFNLNTLSDLHLEKDFRFLLPEINMITEFLEWPGATSRYRYACESNIATAILLFRIATTSRWYDNETNFGAHSSKLSEIFWEQVELLNKERERLLELRKVILKELCELSAAGIHEAGSPV